MYIGTVPTVFIEVGICFRMPRGFNPERKIVGYFRFHARIERGGDDARGSCRRQEVDSIGDSEDGWILKQGTSEKSASAHSLLKLSTFYRLASTEAVRHSWIIHLREI